jgi:membrane protein YqaA with SNARE-associated domain
MEVTALVGYCGSALVVGAASGLVPAVNTEAYLLLVAAMAPAEALPPLLVCVTLGHMAAKALLYATGSGAARLRLAAARAGHVTGLGGGLRRLRAGGSAVVLASAVFGVPPFYLTSVAAGSLRFPLGRFLLLGGSGRLLRFSVIVALPRLLGGTP